MCTTTKIPQKRTCIICEAELFGRSDKVFCNIECKNKYHSILRKTKNAVASATFELQTKNWYILTGLMQKEQNKMLLDRSLLEKLRFNFNYASKVDCKNGKMEYIIFNMKYRMVKHQKVYVEKIKQPGTMVADYVFKRWERKIDLLSLRPSTW